MSSNPVLSAGCLDKILKEKKQSSSSDEKPVVQVLNSKIITSGSVRCILYDGINSTKLVVIKKSPLIEEYFNDNYLENYSVIRLNEYSVSKIPQMNDTELIIVLDITPLMRGSEINRKLEVFNDSAMDPMETSSVDSFAKKQKFNPNYKPRNQSTDGSVVASIDKSKLCSISDIHPFYNSFVIRVRIATKSVVKTYKGKDGKDGKLFSFDATDETSEMRITAFNTECNRFFDLIEKDLIYYISKGSVRTANRKFSNLKSDYEITLNSDSLIELCEESVPLPSIKFRFTPIGQLVEQNKGTSVDVIGVITSVEDLQTIVSKKDQKEYQKRDVSLLDKTLFEVRMTFWSEEAINFCGNVGQVLAVKNVVVGDFRGKTLSSVTNSILELDPDLAEAHLLKGWYDREGTAGRLNDVKCLSTSREEGSTSQLKYLSQINQVSVPEGSVLYYNSKVTIMATNRTDRHLYKSCAKKTCLKKVREDNGFYYCDKCGTNSSDFEYRLMLTLFCADSTADIWVTVFQEVAEKIIGKTTAELSQLFESDPNDYQSVISGLHFKSLNLRIGSKVEEYNNEKRIKSTCFGFTPIDAIVRSKKLIQNIKSWPK